MATKKKTDVAAAPEQGLAAAPAPFDLTEAIRTHQVNIAHENGRWQLWTADGQHADGETPEEAYLNIGSTIVPDAQGRRIRIRRDGSEVSLDPIDPPPAE